VQLAQLLQLSLAFCFSLQPMTAYRPGLDGTPSLAASYNKMLLRAATVLQVLHDLFYCMFYFTCDRSFKSADPPRQISIHWTRIALCAVA